MRWRWRKWGRKKWRGK